MSNSSLICCTILSPNKNSPRNHKIDTITIHCMAAPLSIESCGNWFAKPSAQASSNYGIGPDGRIALYVPEADRSWASSSSSNDNRAITIEVACEKTSPYKVTDAAYNSLVNLCADICRRNGIDSLKWQGDKSLIGQVSKQNMTVHRWFKNKACPGDYLYNKHSDIAARVNMKLTGTTAKETSEGNKTYCGTGIGTAEALTMMAVRNGSTVGAAKYADLSAGTKVEVLAVINGWYKIVWPGASCGYAFTSNVGGKYYKYTANTAAKKVADAKSRDNSLAGKWITTARLNLRTEPDTSNSSNILTVIDSGKAVQCYGYYTEVSGTKWLLVVYNGTTGFISSAYLGRN